MNYFEFYRVPVSFFPDQDVVKKKYYAFCKQYHPDFYIGESEDKQDEALRLSTLNNEAFNVLSNRNTCLEYVLRFYGVIKDGENYQLPSEFLMQMMDLNEEFLEIKANQDISGLDRLLVDITELEKELNDDLNTYCSKFEDSSETERQNILLIIKENYYKHKYLLRIKSDISIFTSLK